MYAKLSYAEPYVLFDIYRHREYDSEYELVAEKFHENMLRVY